MIRAIFNSRYSFILFHILSASLFGSLLILLQRKFSFTYADESLLLLLLPIFYAAFYFAKRTYLTIFVITAIISIGVIQATVTNPIKSFQTMAFVLVTAGASSEMIYRAKTKQQLSEQALKESEARYRIISHNVPAVVYSALPDEHSTNLFLSGKIQELTGYPKEVFIQNPSHFTEIIHPDDRQRVWEKIRQHRESKTDLNIEYRIITKENIVKWIRDTASPLYDEYQNIIQINGCMEDITNRKKTETRIRENEERMRSIVASMPVLLDAFGDEQNIIAWNQECERVTGFKAEEIIGNPDAMKWLYPDEQYRKKVFDTIEKAKGDFRNLEFDVTCKDSSKRTISWSNISNEVPIQGWATWAIGIDITERIKAEKKVIETLKISDDIVQTIPSGLFIYRYEPPNQLLLVYGNPESERLTGIKVQEWLGKEFNEIWPTAKEKGITDDFLGVLQTGMNFETEDLYYKDQRLEGAFRIRVFPLPDQKLAVAFENIIEKKRLEEQLIQSQKMEAVGKLAGGIAHDFNNLLMAILGYSDLTLSLISPEDPIYISLQEIKKAGERAGSLTRQLLAYSRKQVLQPELIDLNQLVFNIDKLLRRLIGEDIEMITIPGSKLGMVRADPGQIEQVIMNLVINARDAMPTGGKLTIETANVDFDEKCIQHRVEIQPGSYVMIAISDTGCGMDEEIQKQIFDPFFTTKEVGKGTGLGLSMVYGIVKQSEGNIFVYSEPNHGTTFKIYFPRIEESSISPRQETDSYHLYKGNETILLVEDEEIVRQFISRILEEAGYQVLKAAYGGEALQISETFSDPIHLLLTDVIMPHMSGRELTESIIPHRPSIKVIYMSGYTDDAIGQHGILEEGIEFMQKPFTPTTLLQKIRNILDNG